MSLALRLRALVASALRMTACDAKPFAHRALPPADAVGFGKSCPHLGQRMGGLLYGVDHSNVARGNFCGGGNATKVHAVESVKHAVVALPCLPYALLKVCAGFIGRSSDGMIGHFIGQNADAVADESFNGAHGSVSFVSSTRHQDNTSGYVVKRTPIFTITQLRVAA